MSKNGPDASYPFCIEIQAEGKRLISLDTDEMEIEIYQRQNGKMVRVFEISCRDKYVQIDLDSTERCPETTVKFVGEDDDEVIELGQHTPKTIRCISEPSTKRLSERIIG